MAYAGQKLVLIENEFGEIGIDGGFLKEAGIEITEMNSGCICCSLVGDFREAFEEGYRPVPAGPHPDRALRRGQAERRDQGRAGHRRRAGCAAEQLCDRGGREQGAAVHEELR